MRLIDRLRRPVRRGSFSLGKSAVFIGIGLVVICEVVLLLNLQAVPGHVHSSKGLTKVPVSYFPEPDNEPRSPVVGSATAIPAGAVSQADIEYLASQKLLIPVSGIGPAQLRDTFGDSRSEGRQHQALDIMAPAATPVMAATSGRIVRLYRSERGGITAYELDPSGRYTYYYAHLMSYAPGLVEGKDVARGETIAYVGDTGNAGPGNFHLHFAISKLGPGDKWSGGAAIDPYPILSGR